jgi:hypothetical protein
MSNGSAFDTLFFILVSLGFWYLWSRLDKRVERIGKDVADIKRDVAEVKAKLDCK